MDAIAQAVESLISIRSNKHSVEYSKISLENSLKYLENHIKNKTFQTSYKMSVAALNAGKAINISRTTAPHALSYPFSSHYGIQHGHAVILTLPDLSSPRTSYMLSKIYGEAICHASNLDFLILRPHNIYGPRMGMKHVIPQLLKKILLTPENGTLDVFSPNHTRTFCYVTYAAEKILDLLEQPFKNKLVLNLGVSQEEIKIKELAKILTEVCERQDITINEVEDTLGSPSRRFPDTSKLINSTKNTKIPSLIEGITHTYNWYKKFLK